MRNFEELAEQLTEHYTERGLLSFKIHKHEQGIEARKAAVTPAEGWPGKNDEARKAARDAAYAADDDLAMHQRFLTEARGKLISLQADIEAVEAERRAAEWQVRAQLLEALSRGGVQPNGRGDRAENAFDDLSQAALDHATTEAVVEAHAEPYEDGIGPDGIEFPLAETAAAADDDAWPFS